jgi:predicted alpha/beta superfamily hydrolase
VSGDSPHSIDVRTGRARFLALWGALVGGLFAIAAALTYIAFLLLPRCAG